MATYKTILQISELGLKGDKASLLRLLQKTAVEEVNNGKHSLYNGLIKLVNKYEEFSSEDFSSSSFNQSINNQHANPETYLPEKIWISPKLQKQLANFINFYKHRTNLKASSINHLNKILLYGLPGTGKTTLGFYIAKSLGKNLRYVKISDIVSSRFGETIKNFSNLFDHSNEEVIFIDEFDAFAKNREDNNDVGELKRIVNAIIQILDFQASKKIVIVSTNLANSIDPAIARRFAFRILVDELDIHEAEDFLSFLIKEEDKVQVNLSNDEISFILGMLDSLTIDAIRVVFEKVLLTGILSKKEKIEFKDFLESLVTEGYFDKKRVKFIKEKSPKKFKVLKETLEAQFAQKEICEMLGMHRNSYKNYF